MVFRTGVRDMVEFVHRRGNLVGEGGFRASNRALEGTRLHRRIQRLRGQDYEPEVTIEFHHADSSIELALHGRVDGLRRNSTPPLVEEIKTVDRFWNGDTDPLHLAQLRIYAAILARQNAWPRVELHLTHVDLESANESITAFEETAESLDAFFDETLRVWIDWLTTQAHWKKLRDASIAELPFPFDGYRAGQRELARRVYRAIRERRSLLLEAPTGLGKTMATLYPAVKSLPALGDGRVFFLTAKTPGRHAAAEAVATLRQSGARLRFLSLTAKKKLCFAPTPEGCDPRVCPYALGYFDRLRPALDQLLARETIDRPAIEETARAHQVCPFELSLDASSWSDVVIGDFNHLFDPTARLQRHFADGGKRHVILIDEAHNLVDRSRDMHSSTLLPDQLVVTPGAVRAKGSATARRALAEAAAHLRDFAPPPEESPSPEHHDGRVSFPDLPAPLVAACRAAANALEKVLVSLKPGTPLTGWIEPWFALQDWLRAADDFDSTCRLIRAPSGEATIFCADPSARLRRDIEGLRAAVFFSATLSPADYFTDLLGTPPETEYAAFDSPFDPSRMHLRILPHDLTFKARPHSLPTVAADVLAHYESAPGNHLVFCPSNTYLSDLQVELQKLAPALAIHSQRPSMTEPERAAFLEKFQPGSRLLALAVLGGIFSEGVDLPGARLNAVTVLGTGLPRLSLERDILRTHFEATRGAGFDYAYRIPGMQRVQQAIGRLIRTEEDHGSALLIDRRFFEPAQHRLFPAWWHPQ